MSLITHILVAATYTLLALAIGTGIWSLGTDLNPALSLLIGGLVLVAGALVHENYTRRLREARMGREIDELKSGYGDVVGELTRLRRDLMRSPRALGGIPEGTGDAVPEIRSMGEMAETIVHDRHAEQWAAETAKAAALMTPRRQLTDEQRARRKELLGGLEDHVVLGLVNEAIRHDRLDLFIQPVVRLPQRRPVFYDCRIHVRTKEGARFLPEQYSPIAEENDVLPYIENLLVARTVAMVRKSIARNRDVAFFLPLSGRTLANPKFLGDFMKLMEQNAGFASKLVFEIAQADIADLSDMGGAAIIRLGQAGYRFCVGGVKEIRFNLPELSESKFRFAKVPAPLLLVREQQFPGERPFENLRGNMDRYAIDMIVDRLRDGETLRDLLDYGIDFGQGDLFSPPTLAEGEDLPDYGKLSA